MMAAHATFKPRVSKAELDARTSEWRSAWRQAEEAGTPEGAPTERVRLNVGAAAVIAFLAAFWICVATAVDWGIDR